MKNLKIQELSIKEMKSINGGDKFLRDVGHAIGSGLRWAEQKMQAFSEYVGEYSSRY